MAEPILKCPSCGASVHLGDIVCPECGVNLKSGESYEARVQKARGKEKHHEAIAGGLYATVVLAFCLLIISGYFFQRRFEGFVRTRPDIFRPFLERFQQIQDWQAARQYEKAREEAKLLVQDIEKAAERIEPPEYYSQENSNNAWKHGYRRREVKYDKRGTKRALFTLKHKAQHILDTIPTQEDPS